MGKEKYKKQIESLFEKSPLVNYKSIERIIKYNGGTQAYAKKLISYLLQSNKIQKIAKGYYTNRNEASLAVFAFQPAYLGLQDALSFHNLWEQETIPVIVTIRNVRQGIRKVLGMNALVRKIDKKYFFGTTYNQQDEVAYPYSDIEKTFIDMVYFKQPLDKELVKEFKKKIDKDKIASYLKKYPKNFRDRVMKALKK